MRFYGTITTNLGQLLKKYNISGVVNVDSLLIETEDGESRSIDFEATEIVTRATSIDFRLKGLHETFLGDWYDLGVTKTPNLENNTELFEKAELAAIVLTSTDDNIFNSNLMDQLKAEVVVNALVVGDKTFKSDNNNIAVIFVD